VFAFLPQTCPNHLQNINHPRQAPPQALPHPRQHWKPIVSIKPGCLPGALAYIGPVRTSSLPTPGAAKMQVILTPPPNHRPPHALARLALPVGEGFVLVAILLMVLLTA
jgi:hypothetical protein